MARNRHHTQRPANPLKVWPNSRKAGSAPGSLDYVGEQAASETIATLIEYGSNEGEYRETQFSTCEEGQGFEPLYHTLWLNLHGLGNTDLLRLVGERFSLHPLVLEDILHTDQRPKVEIYPGYLFIVTRLVNIDEHGRVSAEQVSLILTRHAVLTIQEKPTGTFDGIRAGLKNGQAHIRRLGADYLVYALLDKLVDRYFGVLEKVGEEIEALEDAVSARPQAVQLQNIQDLRRTLYFLRRGLWPMREVVNNLQRDEADFLNSETQLYLRDVYDHTVQLIESLETQRELVGALQDTYLSLQSHHMNVQVRMLTTVATIFMPLTLISSIYGMNFEFMPELHWHWGYYVVLLAMGLLGILLGGFFFRRRWL